jgi:hypothetical protein
MSDDGAHLGYTAEQGMKQVLGGEEPEETMTTAEMAAWIQGATLEQSYDSYNECARYAAKLILNAFLADPSLTNLPAETEYDWDGDPAHGTQGMKSEYIIQLGLYEVLKDRGAPLKELELTGFMYGWALNAARRCVEVGPVPNPAIVTIDIDE